MKKLLAMTLILMMIPMWAMACEEQPLTVRNTTANVFTDPSWWPVTEDCRLPGIKDPDEPLQMMGVQYTTKQFVAGALPKGWAKLNAMIRVVDTGCQVAGLTRLTNVTITVFEQYVELAESVVVDLLGEGTIISANSIVACATYWRGDYAAVIFHPSYSDRVQIGLVSFNNGNNTTPLMLGHFDGVLRFGLKTSDEIAPEIIAAQAAAEAEAKAKEEALAKAQAEAEAAAKAQAEAEARASAEADARARAEAEARAQAEAAAKAQAEATAAAQAAVSVNNSGTIDNSGDGCYRNNVVIQVNLFSIVKQGLQIVKKLCE